MSFIYSCCCFTEDPLKDATWENTKPFVPQVSSGKVIKVYDGDTITIASSLDNANSNEIYRFSVRLLGIDTPEMKSHYESEKELARKAQIALSEQILGKTVTLTQVSQEKYGRILANVIYNGKNMNEWMIEQGHALVYDGGRKEIPEAWRK
jgi:micrococcal nuclease